MDRLDLVQLHCLPTDIYYRPEIFAALDDLVLAGAIANYGVSVERVEEGLKAIEYPGVASVQIIFNMLRQRPADNFLAEAKRRDVGVLARVPLASGLLTGKMSRQTSFEANDHRSYNRHGEAFDVGETFAGVDYDAGLAFVEELRDLVPAGASMTQMALRWILMFDGVTAAIPGAKTVDQARSNAAAADLAALPPATMEKISAMYEERIRPLVHQRW
jgi:aryl-alcohol dehydrogenase-like predicted oxidoreductase